MKRTLSTLAFVLAAGALVGGCAITDYPVVTENGTNGNDSGGGPGDVQRIVNTNGLSDMIEGSKVAKIWGDGSDFLHSMLNQGSDGTSQIPTNNWYDQNGDGATFDDNTYCDADNNGCWVTSAPDDNDGNIFDYAWNMSCLGSRSLGVLVSLGGSPYFQCGNALPSSGLRQFGGLSLGEAVELIDEISEAVTVDGREWLRVRVTPDMGSLSLNFADGSTEQFPIPEQGVQFLCQISDMLIPQCKYNATDPTNIGITLWAQRMADTHGNTPFQISGTVNGRELSFVDHTFGLITQPGFYESKIEQMSPYVEVPGLERGDIVTGTTPSRRTRR